MNESLQVITNMFENVREVIVGKDEQIKQTICCWLAGGHILIEDFPGTGKTMLARAIAISAKVDFKRVQFTADLLPSDVVGSAIYNQAKASFEFVRGPLFTTVFLGDEINRATPRTQSALLEAMGEGQITAEGNTWKLNPMFFVMATQNPVEQHGTFPLPEAQLDRFMMKISMGYPRPEDEINLVKNQNAAHPIHALEPVETEQRLRFVREAIPKIKVADSVYRYAQKLVSATRTSKELKLGASPRAMISLIRAAQSMALMDGLDYVRPTHVYNLAKPVIGHRLIPTSEARLSDKTADQILTAIIQEIQVPVS
ncbi:MAG: MoxR family ATPase [Deltaproteobacteria bacterium]|nr:MoxR family ATPase [Deltaproteobacteria bacterium]